MAEPAVSVWKRLPDVADGDDDGDVPEDSDDLCNICMVKAVSILMLPCQHPACDTCISKMRAANVYKVGAC